MCFFFKRHCTLKRTTEIQKSKNIIKNVVFLNALFSLSQWKAVRPAAMSGSLLADLDAHTAAEERSRKRNGKLANTKQMEINRSAAELTKNGNPRRKVAIAKAFERVCNGPALKGIGSTLFRLVQDPDNECRNLEQAITKFLEDKEEGLITSTPKNYWVNLVSRYREIQDNSKQSPGGLPAASIKAVPTPQKASPFDHINFDPKD